MKRIILEFLNKVKYESTELIQNINYDLCDNSQKRILVVYINDSFATNFSKENIFHTNIFEVNQMIKIFINKGYAIDLVSCIDYKSLEVIKENEYHLIFGFGDIFYEICKLNPKAKKILYMTENHPSYSYRKENERVEYYFERHNKRVNISRSYKYYKEEHFEIINYAIILGELEPYEKYDFKKYSLFPTGLYNGNYMPTSRNYEMSKKNFLWFGSTGAIHKGLDILLDVFKHRKDINLHICGLQKNDERILKIPKSENIINHRRINVQSEKFLYLANKCSYIILPSCSEGFSTSIATGMRHSLIPIIMRDTGFNRLNDMGIFINDFHLENVEAVINKVIKLDNEYLEKMHNKVYGFANKVFTIDNFSRNFKKIIDDIGVIKVENRDKVIIKNTLQNYLYQFLIMGLGFLAVPITLNYLGVEKYGMWVTILSILSWMNISDFGIGNGLRNKIAEGIADNKYHKVKEHISSAYYCIGIIAIIIAIASITTIYILGGYYDVVFNLKLPLLVMVLGFSINFFLGVSRFVAYGKQESALVGLTQFATSSLSILGVIIISRVSDGNILMLALVYNSALIIANIILSIIIYVKDKRIIPNFANIKKDSFKEISNVGLKFFVIQLSGVILFTTDNLIITKFINLESVTTYNIISKIYDSITSIYSIVLIAIWSSVTHAFVQGDAYWIKSIIMRLRKLLFLLTILVILVSFLFDKIIYIWLRRSINFPIELILIFALYTILISWNGIYSNIVNGMGKINLQLYLSLVGAIINIPLSIILAVNLNMGITGVKFATFLCILLTSIALPIQVRKELKQMKSDK